MPYDWKNPIGYLVTAIWQYISLQRLLGFLGLASSFGIGGLLFGITVVRDMKSVLKLTNESTISHEENKSEVLKKLYEFIEIHAMVKELSD